MGAAQFGKKEDLGSLERRESSLKGQYERNGRVSQNSKDNG